MMRKSIEIKRLKTNSKILCAMNTLLSEITKQLALINCLIKINLINCLINLKNQYKNKLREVLKQH